LKIRAALLKLTAHNIQFENTAAKLTTKKLSPIYWNKSHIWRPKGFWKICAIDETSVIALN